MNSMELYQLLEIPPAIIGRLIDCESRLNLADLEPFLREMMAWETAAEAYESLKSHLREDDGGFKMLFCQLECARRCRAEYRARGIPESTFVDTMKCFQRFLHECERKTGEMYFDRGWWTYRQISMRLFRIGQLEYELCSTQTEKTVSVHIPSDAAFAPEFVDESLQLAKCFIDLHFPDYGNVRRVCDSWLLSPKLKEILSEESNILDFQRRFDIVEENAEERGFIEWLFQVPKDTEISLLPEHTRLQKAAKELLRVGETIGEAYGIMT